MQETGIAKKDIGTTIDKSNILPPENRREKKKTSNDDEFTSADFLSRRKKWKNEFKKLREKDTKSSEEPAPKKRGRPPNPLRQQLRQQKPPGGPGRPRKLKPSHWADSIEIVNVSHAGKTENDGLPPPKDPVKGKKNDTPTESEGPNTESGQSEASSRDNGCSSHSSNIPELEKVPDERSKNGVGVGSISTELHHEPLIQEPSCLTKSSSGRKLKPVARLDT